jgi:hypothetical protein
VRVRRLQANEIWCFIGAKAKNVKPEKKAEGWGDVWTWTGLDRRQCRVGTCHRRPEEVFFEAEAIEGDRQFKPFEQDGIAVRFGADIDYAQLQKIYGALYDAEMRRYSPAKCIGADTKTVSGDPDPKHVSTSYVERHNLTMRMGMLRFTRLTNGFSKKIENHIAMVAIHAVYYNFARIHKTLRITPAMAAGLCDHVWSLEEIVLLAN